MADGRNPGVSRPERGDIRVEDLHLDRVVSSQPEIGPTPPDGGYGWLIVVSAMVYHVTVPALVTLYGLIILKAVRQDGHEDDEKIKIWDVDIALVPVICLVVKLLLESWSRAVVKVFNMPRFMALAGLCLTVAGVLLSSYSTDADSNDKIVNIFAGLFIGMGCALTGMQTEVILTIYFRDNLTIAQRLVRIAPSIGNCIVPIVVGYSLTKYTGDVVVMLYGAILMQNCFFLAAYTRPVYIEKVIRTTYRRIIDAGDDDDEIIFSNQSRSEPPTVTQVTEGPSTQEDPTDVVVFNSRINAKEILDPDVQQRERAISNERRFSSDFSGMYNDNNRFSSDFGTLDITSYSRIGPYQELENIDRDAQNPQPLYRETTVNAPDENLVFSSDMTVGTARRTAMLKKHFITVANMLVDVNFYLYTVLHLCTTFSTLVLLLFFPIFFWEKNPSLNIWGVTQMVTVAHGLALCFILLCVLLPQTFNHKARLCSACCVIGGAAFYGITLSNSMSFLVYWCIVAAASTTASSILQQPLYNSTLNEFSRTATITFANTIAAVCIIAWALMRNYFLNTCFLTASILQFFTAAVFFVASFRRQR
ncbi:uncharacterized protein LOC128671877 [Plodia interpunctella]|uniref:uncharacterized protein LOC128671877 n=1 Tax=Plodia interpunctella TaxID=58824 RepID=UPI00236859A1|nr:uncharacterized protein LOC128671877 [Plodia interpunctella]